MTDQQDAIERLESELLGDSRKYTRTEVAERANVSIERAERLWRSLGFASTADDEKVFGDADVEALAAIIGLVDQGIVTPESEASVARSLGQAMARLADWQTALISGLGDGDDLLDLAADAAADLVPRIEELHSYVWRRHLVAAAGRILPVGGADDADTDTMVVGFADIVGFTSLSRTSSEEDLAALVEEFETVTSDVIAENRGRVVKMIGDEVLFVVKDPAAAAKIALGLMEWRGEEDNPELRIGLAYGRVISWLGDVYGPVVNVASRLTSVARPGSIVVDRDLAAALEEDESFKLRKIRRVSVRGYSHLEPWVLKAKDTSRSS
jgi:adenylate cyclase